MLPRKQRQAQIDGGGVHGIHRFGQLQSEGFFAVERARQGDQNLAEFGKDSPIAVLVGMSQVVARHLAAETHVIQLRLLRPQTGFDIAQAFPTGQLREGQTEKLIEAREGVNLVVTSVTLHAAAKLLQGQKVHQLSKHSPTGIHALFLVRRGIAPEYRSFSNRFSQFWPTTPVLAVTCGEV